MKKVFKIPSGANEIAKSVVRLREAFGINSRSGKAGSTGGRAQSESKARKSGNFLAFGMFGGLFGRDVIHATHPFVVVEGENISGSFSTLAAAEDFITNQRNFSAIVLRHHGQKWVSAKERLVQPFLRNAQSEISQHQKH